jgi:hypothetical protein
MLKNKNTIILSALLLIIVINNSPAQENSSEILTLFTTQQERVLIDNNRYRVKQKESVVSAVQAEKPESEGRVILKQETLSLKVSGITLTQDGKNIAWINGKAHENGGKLDDGSKVYINPKVKNFAQIKTPDGKYHSISTGETTELTYLVPIQKQ